MVRQAVSGLYLTLGRTEEMRVDVKEKEGCEEGRVQLLKGKELLSQGDVGVGVVGSASPHSTGNGGRNGKMDQYLLRLRMSHRLA